MFLYVGHLRKGARQCIEALAQLDRGMLLCVSSSDSEAYRRFAVKCGLEGRVIFRQHTESVERAFGAADALLLPTPYDSFAMVVSEAMACGLPVVVSQEAGVVELIEHGRNGLILRDFTSTAELTRHMRALSGDRPMAAALGRAARKTVETMTWDAVAEQTMQVYQDLLRRKAAK